MPTRYGQWEKAVTTDHFFESVSGFPRPFLKTCRPRDQMKSGSDSGRSFSTSVSIKNNFRRSDGERQRALSSPILLLPLSWKITAWMAEPGDVKERLALTQR
ncbi:hypothetical protein HAX54_009235 [Datura stramonium]|uniref:Uncharacterized protein n=1 Tax=Datura stramonium TaxID=4076 RepID=A0ABS8RIC7_DATST|nr:hypothetical protein [Datura stramonium]